MQGPDIKCQLCEDIFNLNADDIEKLHSNRVIEEILRVNKKYELWSFNGSPERKCEMCTEKRNAIVSCLDCRKDMCKQCISVHSQIPATLTHVTLEITPENEQRIDVRKAKHYCKRHDFGRVVTNFCLQCEEMKCDKCHADCSKRNHELIGLPEYASGLRDDLGLYLQNSNIKLRKCDEFLGNIYEKEKILSENQNASLKNIQTLSYDFKAVVEQCAERMRTRVKRKHEKRERELSLEKHEIESEKTKTQTLIDNLNVVHQWGSNAHVIMEYESLKNRLDFLDTIKYHSLHDSGELSFTHVKHEEATKQFSSVCWEQFEKNFMSCDKMRLPLLHASETSTEKTTINQSIESQKVREVKEFDLKKGEGDNNNVDNISDSIEPSIERHLQSIVRNGARKYNDSFKEHLMSKLQLPPSPERKLSPGEIEQSMSGSPRSARSSRRPLKPLPNIPTLHVSQESPERGKPNTKHGHAVERSTPECGKPNTVHGHVVERSTSECGKPNTKHGHAVDRSTSCPPCSQRTSGRLESPLPYPITTHEYGKSYTKTILKL